MQIITEFDKNSVKKNILSEKNILLKPSIITSHEDNSKNYGSELELAGNKNINNNLKCNMHVNDNLKYNEHFPLPSADKTCILIPSDCIHDTPKEYLEYLSERKSQVCFCKLNDKGKNLILCFFPFYVYMPILSIYP